MAPMVINLVLLAQVIAFVGHTMDPKKARLILRVLCDAWRAGDRWKTLGASWRTSSRGRLPRMWRLV